MIQRLPLYPVGPVSPRRVPVLQVAEAHVDRYSVAGDALQRVARAHILALISDYHGQLDLPIHLPRGPGYVDVPPIAHQRVPELREEVRLARLGGVQLAAVGGVVHRDHQYLLRRDHGGQLPGLREGLPEPGYLVLAAREEPQGPPSERAVQGQGDLASQIRARGPGPGSHVVVRSSYEGRQAHPALQLVVEQLHAGAAPARIYKVLAGPAPQGRAPGRRSSRSDASGPIRC